MLVVGLCSTERVVRTVKNGKVTTTEPAHGD